MQGKRRRRDEGVRVSEGKKNIGTLPGENKHQKNRKELNIFCVCD